MDHQVTLEEVLTAFYQMSVPTGQYKGRALSPVITPTIAYGKGFGNFNVQGTLGISPPTGNEQLFGRNLIWNAACQYKLFKKIWSETEVNFTQYQGPHNGMTSVYLTTGVVLGRFHLWDRLGFTAGGGLRGPVRAPNARRKEPSPYGLGTQGQVRRPTFGGTFAKPSTCIALVWLFSCAALKLTGNSDRLVRIMPAIVNVP